MQEAVNGYGKAGSGRRGGAMSFVAFTLEHADCGDAVVELGVDGSPVACWCTRHDDARTFNLAGTPEDSSMQSEQRGEELQEPTGRREGAEDAVVRRGGASEEERESGSAEGTSIPDYVMRDFDDAGDEAARRRDG